MKETKMIPFNQEPVLDTESLMAGLGITRQEANALLWKMFDDDIIDLIPRLNEGRAVV
ncbi:hypothetical protein [Pedobacter heparinus]|uniref:Uncharacterized protein n=1 Tax=Pedobacter heparinus (strain ATCC 13125 / DSM 2366 / CIP 104194 / JCM 7457 / NBRC 12017 / NCIMB 9290 / NRRL B-14731 / HIM 762-3) TaxID=485917 RepID=C6Y3L9_PEDHD|nr:hypothetical protein [Pedobacter heparinus]ACU03298.1 hypothetical protein Phep_1080 [Pedobacter heparinus DSM 2366]